MLNARLRLAYLQAMDVELWLPRHSAFPAQASITTAVPYADLDWAQLIAVTNTTDQGCSSACRALWSGQGNLTSEYCVVLDQCTEETLKTNITDWLHALLAAIGLTHEQVFIRQVAACTSESLTIGGLTLPHCAWFLRRQLALLQPKLLLLLGSNAVQRVLGDSNFLDLTSAKIETLTIQTITINTVMSQAPMKFLTEPLIKRELWRQLQQALANLER